MMIRQVCTRTLTLKVLSRLLAATPGGKTLAVDLHICLSASLFSGGVASSAPENPSREDGALL